MGGLSSHEVRWMPAVGAEVCDAGCGLACVCVAWAKVGVVV